MYQQALLSWGNLQYEESQLVAVAGGDWRAILDEATAHFREAGCNEADIRGGPRIRVRSGSRSGLVLGLGLTLRVVHAAPLGPPRGLITSTDLQA